MAEPSTSFRVVLIDQDNVRAAAGWPDARLFRDRVTLWAKACSEPTVIVVEVDEKKKQSSSNKKQKGSLSEHRQRTRAIGANVVANFLGPRWQADDGIVRDLEWWLLQQQGALTGLLIVSSDRQVRRRCSEVKQRLPASAAVRYETGDAFALALPPLASTTAGTATDVACTLDGPLAVFTAWIEREQPGPTQTASEIVHAGERSRLGKRKLGVYR